MVSANGSGSRSHQDQIPVLNIFDMTYISLHPQISNCYNVSTIYLTYMHKLQQQKYLIVSQNAKMFRKSCQDNFVYSTLLANYFDFTTTTLKCYTSLCLVCVKQVDMRPTKDI